MAVALKPGDKAPDFSLIDQHGKTVRLSDYRGKKLLVYFYPKADTPGCTKQSCAVRDARQDLKGLSVEVLGISPDPVEDQLKFDTKYSLGFPLLADTAHQASDAYGVWGDKSAYGRIFKGVTRSSFLVDEEGKLLRVWYAVKPEETVPKAREALQELAAGSQAA
jgi:peroxiredoxin Q/BCP